MQRFTVEDGYRDVTLRQSKKEKESASQNTVNAYDDPPNGKD